MWSVWCWGKLLELEEMKKGLWSELLKKSHSTQLYPQSNLSMFLQVYKMTISLFCLLICKNLCVNFIDVISISNIESIIIIVKQRWLNETMAKTHGFLSQKIRNYNSGCVKDLFWQLLRKIGIQDCVLDSYHIIMVFRTQRQSQKIMIKFSVAISEWGSHINFI